MTFLEYVAMRLMGRPVYSSCWPCPYCDSTRASLSVRPPKAGYPIKFKCFRCSAWGDEFDLIQHFYPTEHYGLRKDRLHSWRLDYERELNLPAMSTFTH